MKTTDQIGKYYYFFPQSVALISVRDNVMPAAWHTPISSQPPLYGILISPKRHTYGLLQEAAGFTVNFLPVSRAALVAQTGRTSGREGSKLDRFGAAYKPAQKVPAAILDDAYAAYECEKYAVAEYGDHFLFVGRIVLLHYQEGIVNAAGFADENKVAPILYFGKDRYLTIDPKTLKIIEG
jgi:flavin reductase (DIM6/NTAB) family NADH-FMN oxidoreductase RutF